MFKRQYSRITDYNNSFLEDQLDRPQISLIALIIDFDLNDIVEIWEIIGLSMRASLNLHGYYKLWYSFCVFFSSDDEYKNSNISGCKVLVLGCFQDAGLEILQWKSIMISTTFQQHATEIIVPDLHITEQIQCVNTYSATNQQLYNKKVRYAKRFGKMKKALNLELDFGFDKETKKFFRDQSHDELVHIHHAMNSQNFNLRIPLSNIDPNNSHAIGENKKNMFVIFVADQDIMHIHANRIVIV
ncbi:5445_t:CDS:2 [Gigaspora rosea]|nr:5445_t:CDS:2 [Gigaspora rosea]